MVTAALVGLALVAVALLAILVRRPAFEPLAGDLARLSQSVEHGAKAAREDAQRVERTLRDEAQAQRTELGKSQADLRVELGATVKSLSDSLLQQNKTLAELQKAQLDGFSVSIENLRRFNTDNLEAVRQTVEKRLVEMQAANEKKLEEMRRTVDEKLQGTLEKRLGESFKLVSERLEQVQKGLGEMQALATGVGDLKKVLSNVKARGTWGEIQLGALLEEMLSPEQYERNARIRPRSPEVVEFAVKLPGSEGEGAVYLPIDSKFPKEDYERLQQAQERGDPAGADEAAAALDAQIRKCARDIRDKYVHPPYSTDFGILFVPVESLYAEILRRPALVAVLQNEYRVILAGPTTFAALLNSLQMGFRTLAIQKRSSEVWRVLGAVKAEFGKFSDLLDKVGKQLETAQKTIGAATSKSKTIESKLRGVEELPAGEARFLLEAGGQIQETASSLLETEGPHGTA